MSVTPAISSAQLQISKRGKLAYATAYASFPRFDLAGMTDMHGYSTLVCVCVWQCKILQRAITTASCITSGTYVILLVLSIHVYACTYVLLLHNVAKTNRVVPEKLQLRTLVDAAILRWFQPSPCNFFCIYSFCQLSTLCCSPPSPEDNHHSYRVFAWGFYRPDTFLSPNQWHQNPKGTL